MRARSPCKGVAYSLILWLLLATAGPLLTRGASPLACAAAIHVCSCAPDPHSASACCCAASGSEAHHHRFACHSADTPTALPAIFLPHAVALPRITVRPADRPLRHAVPPATAPRFRALIPRVPPPKPLA